MHACVPHSLGGIFIGPFRPVFGKPARIEQSKRAHLFLIHIGPFSPVRILASKFLTFFTHCIPAVTSKGLPPVHGTIQCYTVHTVLLLHILSMGLSHATDGIHVALRVDG